MQLLLAARRIVAWQGPYSLGYAANWLPYIMITGPQVHKLQLLYDQTLLKLLDEVHRNFKNA